MEHLTPVFNNIQAINMTGRKKLKYDNDPNDNSFQVNNISKRTASQNSLTNPVVSSSAVLPNCSGSAISEINSSSSAKSTMDEECICNCCKTTLLNYKTTINVIGAKLHNISRDQHLETRELFSELFTSLSERLDRIEKTIGSTAPKQQEYENILAIFPLKDFCDLQLLQENLMSPEYASKLISSLRVLSGPNINNFSTSFKFVATDEFYSHFNWEGRNKKAGLNQYSFFNNILFEAWNSPYFGKDLYTFHIKMELSKAKSRGRLLFKRK